MAVLRTSEEKPQLEPAVLGMKRFSGEWFNEISVDTEEVRKVSLSVIGASKRFQVKRK